MGRCMKKVEKRWTKAVRSYILKCSPVATGGFWGLSTPKQSSKTPPNLNYEAF